MACCRRKALLILACLRSLKSLISGQKLVFCLGFGIGVTLAIILHFIQNPDHVMNHFHLLGLASGPYKQGNQDFKTLSYFEAKYDYAYEKWLYSSFDEAQSYALDPDLRRYTSNETNVHPRLSNISSNFVQDVDQYLKEKSVLDPRSEAYFLYKTINVICIVFPKDLDWASAVHSTWGQHCNELRFFSHEVLNVSVNIELLKATSDFSLICQSLQTVFKDYETEYDNFWVMIATQDTYVLIENLRFYVAPLNQSGSYYLGHAMKFWNSVYNWADAGYVISFNALKRFIKEKFPDRSSCESGGKHWKNGDWYLGRHFSELGIKPQDTRDHAGRGRFNGYSLQRLLFPGGVSLFERYWRDSLFLSRDGPHCCSNYAVTFHGIVSKSKMYQLEYLYYHLLPFYGGGKHGNSPPPPSKRDQKAPALTWEEHLKEEALAKLFGPGTLMTTPKDMEKIMAQSML